MNGRQSTGVIRSACPRHHPVNTQQCCDHGGTYCTCVFQDTLDVNWKVYNELGGQNGYSSSVTVGGCGRTDTGIDIRSAEAVAYMKLKGAHLCSVNHDLGADYHKNLVENNIKAGIDTKLSFKPHHHHHDD